MAMQDLDRTYVQSVAEQWTHQCPELAAWAHACLQSSAPPTPVYFPPVAVAQAPLQIRVCGKRSSSAEAIHSKRLRDGC
eukprot:6198421-Pleurochrysis_carterae.AAC.6